MTHLCHFWVLVLSEFSLHHGSHFPCVSSNFCVHARHLVLDISVPRRSSWALPRVCLLMWSTLYYITLWEEFAPLEAGLWALLVCSTRTLLVWGYFCGDPEAVPFRVPRWMLCVTGPSPCRWWKRKPLPGWVLRITLRLPCPWLFPRVECFPHARALVSSPGARGAAPQLSGAPQLHTALTSLGLGPCSITLLAPPLLGITILQCLCSCVGQPLFYTFYIFCSWFFFFSQHEGLFSPYYSFMVRSKSPPVV